MIPMFCLQCAGKGEDRTEPLLDCWECKGTGFARCEAKGCRETAVAIGQDGDALCEDCLMEEATEQ